jgi:type 1 glutamine amidotransferase
MKAKKALLLLGGVWHDFEGFARAVRPWLESGGWSVEATCDLDRLTRLDKEGVDLVLSYTCFSRGPGENGQPGSPEKMSGAQIHALRRWVRGGGALLGAHSATVLGKSSPLLGELMGGVFVEHPPALSFTVYPVYGDHPITAGIKAFSVHDELYMQRCSPSVDVHMLAIDHGTAYPMVWSKAEGRGRVAHVAPGHSAKVWKLEPYRRLMLQAVAWVTGE